MSGRYDTLSVSASELEVVAAVVVAAWGRNT